MMSKLGLAIALVAVAGGALWIEHSHRVVIDAPVADAVVARAACSDTDAVPYSTACVEYLHAFEVRMRWTAGTPSVPTPQ